MKEKIKRILTLLGTFLKIGAFTFGGGYAMIPLIQKEVVEKHKWMTDDDILEIVAIAESTPGPIAINAATFVGYRTAGFFGAFCATVGVVLPSFVIISVRLLGITGSILQVRMQKSCWQKTESRQTGSVQSGQSLCRGSDRFSTDCSVSLFSADPVFLIWLHRY